MKRSPLLLLLALFVAVSCSHKLEGPTPTVQKSDLTYCGADQQGFVIKGAGLSPMAEQGATSHANVTLPKVCLTRVADKDGNPVSGEKEVCIPEEDVEWVSQSEIHFTVRGDLGLAPGQYDVVIKNPDGKQAKGKISLTVLSDGPILFWADPNYVYSGITTAGTLYGANLGTVDSVELVNSDSSKDQTPTELDFKQSGTKDNRIQANVPNGMADGTYDVIVKSKNGCEADLGKGVHVVSNTDLTLTAIDPEFGWTNETTPVTMTGDGFQPVPRAYLNPNPVQPDSVASPMASVALVNGQKLTGVVPKGLPVGAYDLIVVNPDGKVGLIKKAFQVTKNAPPVVDNVSPNYLDNDGDKTVTIDGSNFDNPTVTAECKQPDGTITSIDGTVQSGGSATSFQCSLPVGGLPQGTVCVVRVTNADGSYYDYSAIGISNPSSNLNPFATGPEMTTARRAPAVTAGRATTAARFLYAIGGDSGSPGGALASVEAAPLDKYGEVGDWFTQQVSLPGKRTLAGVTRVGRFLYLVGGNDGGGATDSVLRAEVLDPGDAPAIVDVAGRRNKKGVQEGISAGVWYYRVSAVMADNDPSNPGGETLPSDPMVVSLDKDTFQGSLVLTLFWNKIDGAKAYRIYRNEKGTETVGNEKCLAEVPAGTLQYEDTATPGTIQGNAPVGKAPLPLGSTGVWKPLAKLGTAREAPGVAAAQAPGAADTFYIYAAGGRTNQPMASTERLKVTVAADGSQTVGQWTGSGSLSSARAELSLFSMSHSQAVQVPKGTTYLYAGGGQGTGNSASNVDVAQVAADGSLSWTQANGMSPARSGYAGIGGAGFLFAFGGTQAKASDSCASAEIDPSNVPQLINWNNEGVKLNTPRYLAGGTEESAFIYIVGGTNGGALKSIERTVL